MDIKTSCYGLLVKSFWSKPLQNLVNKCSSINVLCILFVTLIDECLKKHFQDNLHFLINFKHV